MNVFQQINLFNAFVHKSRSDKGLKKLPELFADAKGELNCNYRTNYQKAKDVIARTLHQVPAEVEIDPLLERAELITNKEIELAILEKKHKGFTALLKMVPAFAEGLAECSKESSQQIFNELEAQIFKDSMKMSLLAALAMDTAADAKAALESDSQNIYSQIPKLSNEISTLPNDAKRKALDLLKEISALYRAEHESRDHVVTAVKIY